MSDSVQPYGQPVHQAPPSTGFSRQEYWSGLPFASPMHACMLSHLSCVRLCAILWTAVHQAPPSTGFSRQEFWSGLPFKQIKPKKKNKVLLLLQYLPLFFNQFLYHHLERKQSRIMSLKTALTKHHYYCVS